jgi:hypothetical protein
MNRACSSTRDGEPFDASGVPTDAARGMACICKKIRLRYPSALTHNAAPRAGPWGRM